MFDVAGLEKLLPEESAFLLDASDFARLNQLDLDQLNLLIQQVNHEIYPLAVDPASARASVVSLINLGFLSPCSIYGIRQYA